MPMLFDEPVITLQFMQTVFFSSVISLSQATGASASSTLLFLLFNDCTFFNLSDIIDHIYDYPIGFKCVNFYCNIVEQMAVIFEIGLFFASNLIKIVKKYKSWQNEE